MTGLFFQKYWSVIGDQVIAEVKQFADDSLFVCKVNVAEVKVLQSILKTYGDETGQIINLNKSSLTFGSLIEEKIKAEIIEITGIVNEEGARSYLGLPEYFSGSKIKCLALYTKE